MAGKLRLIVMRHGEAENMTAQGDRNRTLTETGRKQTEMLGQLLREGSWEPDSVLVSSAARTKESFERASEGFSQAPSVRFLDNLYLAPWESVLGEISRSQDTTVMVVGHNPGCSDLIEHLTGDRVGLMPSETALLTIEGESWQDATQMAGLWQCTRILSP